MQKQLDDRDINRLDQTLADIATLVADREYQRQFPDEPLATLAESTREAWKVLRTIVAAKSDLEKQDSFGTDPTLQNRRHVYIGKITETQITFELEILPQMHELYASLVAKAPDDELTKRLGDALTRYGGKEAVPTASLLEAVYLVTSDPGQRQQALRSQLHDVLKAMQYQQVKELSSTSDSIVVVAETTLTQQLAVIRYTPDVESSKLTTEIEALFGQLSFYRKTDERDVAGLFLTLQPVPTDQSPVAPLLEDGIRIVGRTEFIDALSKARTIVSIEHLRQKADDLKFPLGALVLVHYDNRYYWVADSHDKVNVTLFASQGTPISRQAAMPVLAALAGWLGSDLAERYRDLSERQASPILEPIESKANKSIAVSHRASRGWFDYRDPSHPDFFVGRQDDLQAFFTLVADVRSGAYPDRGAIIQAPSGSGKSSFILKLAAESRRTDDKCFIYSTDARGCTGGDYLGVVFDDFLRRLIRWDAIPDDMQDDLIDILRTSFASFTATIEAVERLNVLLKSNQLVACLFFDQFEFLVFYPNVVNQIANLMMSLSESQANIIIGIGIRSDINLPRFAEFPFRIWSTIQQRSWTLELGPLDPAAEHSLVQQIETTIGGPLSALTVCDALEFAEGRPWILKRLGASFVNEHQMEQSFDTSTIKFRPDRLFAEDLRELKEEELMVIKVIANLGPVTIGDVASNVSKETHEYLPSIIDGLVDKRLLSKIGERYDTYHDQFKDYVLQHALDPNERTRFEVETLMRVFRSNTTTGIPGTITFIFTAPAAIIAARDQRDYCLSVIRQIAELALNMVDAVTVVLSDENARFRVWIQSYVLYAVLERVEGASESTTTKMGEIVQLIGQQITEITNELLEFLGRVLLPRDIQTIDAKISEDQTNYADWMRGKALGMVDRDEGEMLTRLLPRLSASNRQAVLLASFEKHLFNENLEGAEEVLVAAAAEMNGALREFSARIDTMTAEYETAAEIPFSMRMELDFEYRFPRGNEPRSVYLAEALSLHEKKTRQKILKLAGKIQSKRLLLGKEVDNLLEHWPDLNNWSDDVYRTQIHDAAYWRARFLLRQDDRPSASRLIPDMIPERALEIALAIDEKSTVQRFLESSQLQPQSDEPQATGEFWPYISVNDVFKAHLKAGRLVEAETYRKTTSDVQDEVFEAVEDLLFRGDVETAKKILMESIKSAEYTTASGANEQYMSLWYWWPKLGFPLEAAAAVINIMK